MKIPSMSRDQGLKFNITPMIDIVFLLIIFFLIASYLSNSEYQEEIQLANAKAGQSDRDSSARRVLITVTSTGEILSGTKPINVAAFGQLLESHKTGGNSHDLEIRLRIDKRAAFDKVKPLLMECAKANVSRLKFSVLNSN